MVELIIQTTYNKKGVAGLNCIFKGWSCCNHMGIMCSTCKNTKLINYLTYKYNGQKHTR